MAFFPAEAGIVDDLFLSAAFSALDAEQSLQALQKRLFQTMDQSNSSCDR